MTLTISQLIEKLGECQEAFGDLEVYINGLPMLNYQVMPIDTNPDSEPDVVVLYKYILHLTTE